MTPTFCPSALFAVRQQPTDPPPNPQHNAPHQRPPRTAASSANTRCAHLPKSSYASREPPSQGLDAPESARTLGGTQRGPGADGIVPRRSLRRPLRRGCTVGQRAWPGTDPGSPTASRRAVAPSGSAPPPSKAAVLGVVCAVLGRHKPTRRALKSSTLVLKRTPRRAGDQLCEHCWTIGSLRTRLWAKAPTLLQRRSRIARRTNFRVTSSHRPANNH